MQQNVGVRGHCGYLHYMDEIGGFRISDISSNKKCNEDPEVNHNQVQIGNCMHVLWYARNEMQ